MGLRVSFVYSATLNYNRAISFQCTLAYQYQMIMIFIMIIPLVHLTADSLESRLACLVIMRIARMIFIQLKNYYH